jgi:tripartite-type tricarboxylate transporter receptor subunit TctC
MFHPTLARGIAGVAALFALASVHAQEYPSRPIRIIAPFPAGSGPDVNTRELAAKLAPAIGGTVIVENRPGASGTIGTEAGARATPDGYTLVIGSTSTISIVPYVFTKLNYSTERDLVPISLLGVLQTGLIAHPGVPAANARDLIALAKARPGTVNVANQGIGSYSHLASEWFASASNTDLKFIPYATTSVYGDLVGGQIQLMFDGLPAAVGNIRSGKLKLLAITGRARHPAFPDTPTFAEAGLPGDYEPLAWQGLFAPAGTPRAVIDKIGAGMAQVGKAADLAEKWRSYGGELRGSSPADFAAFVKADQARWSAVVRRANVKLD